MYPKPLGLVSAWSGGLCQENAAGEMNKRDIQLWYEYNRWANAEVLAAATTLTAEQFKRDLSSSYGSVRDTLVNILSAEWSWLMCWHGISPLGGFEASEFPDIETLKAKWTEPDKVHQ
jgi:uncharacterized damage-inducible protein DinB